MIYDAFLKHVAEQPDHPALYVWDEQWGYLTYRALHRQAAAVAEALKNCGLRPAEPVAICLERHDLQAVAAIGILLAGGAYVPCGPHLPWQRRAAVLAKLDCRLVVGDPGDAVRSEHPCICLDPEAPAPVPDDPAAAGCSPASDRFPTAEGRRHSAQLAYVIFTSGSTGEPKGVMISHAGAWGTIADVNRRFGVTSADLAIGVSQFDFDLSVYDLFGLLSAGGSLAVLPHHRARDPYFWKETLKQLPVTLWNSVPALLDMMLSVWTETDGRLPLKKIFLSGDWIYPAFCRRIRELAGDACLVAMGGATEASIWSNYFKVDEVDEQWVSVPYGYPLKDQFLRVVDDAGRPCDVGAAGHLLIGGQGVAIGYWGDDARTGRQFFECDGRRWYRTGDRACLHPDGYIVFLGRSDQQLKLNGYRVEPGEIEKTIEQIPGVEKGHVLPVRRPGGMELHAFYKMTPNAAGPLTAPDCDLAAGQRDAGQDATAAALIRMLLAELERQPAPPGGPHFPEVIRAWRVFLHTAGSSQAPPDAALLAAFDSLKPLYLDILNGRRPALELLNQPLLNPGALMLRDRYMAEAFRVIRQRVQQLAVSHASAGPLKVVFLAPIEPQLLPVLLSGWPSHAAASFIAAQRGAYSALQAAVESCGAPAAADVLPRFDPWIEDDDIGAFDLAVSVHGFHRGIRPEDGPLLAGCLLKPGGTLLFAEQDDLPAMGLLTALLLENGFKDILGRPGVGNPMLPGAQWAPVLQAAGYSRIHIKHMSGSQVFVAEGCLERACPAIPSHKVQEKLAERLPAYMMPRSLHLLPFYRYGANQKIDWSVCRRALETVDDAGGQPPQGKTEAEIAAIWQRLLQVETIGRHTSFFKLGGDSLLAMRFLGELNRRYGIRPDIHAFLGEPTVAASAAAVDRMLHEEMSSPIEEGEI